MKMVTCTNCGANDLIEKNGYMICEYCETRYIIKKEDLPFKSSNIKLDDDIQLLLEKCRKEPHNARRYANLILDIDPRNKDALKYTK